MGSAGSVAAWQIPVCRASARQHVRQTLEDVPGLHKVDVHALVESELEARFIKALRRVEAAGHKPRVQQDMAAGKLGCVLKIGAIGRFMEPQASIGQASGVTVPNRPYFLLCPMRGEAVPGAVFMDELAG